MQDIRVAVFGNGFARSVILPCLRHVPEMKVVGIASPTIERARETATTFDIEHVTQDHRELIALCRPDLVFVVTPPHRHLEQSVDALRSGCHVVCENRRRWSRGAVEGHAGGRVGVLASSLCSITSCASIRAASAGRESNGERFRGDPHRRIRDVAPVPPQPSCLWTCGATRSGRRHAGALGSHAVDALRVILGTKSPRSAATWRR
ncbi:MAG: Gfo/Idh/MocA family oxidoreductase [Candidatus Eisenbacteria bacterium]